MTLRKPDYERNGIVLFNADCRDILPHLSGVDAVVTDPPYGIVNQFGSNTGNGTRTMQFAGDDAEAVGLAVGLAVQACNKSASAFVFAGFDTVEFARDALRKGEFTVKPAAWFKKCPPPAGFGNWWPSAFEIAMYGYRNSPWFGDDDPKRCNVFVEDSYRFGQPGKVDHPTQKPLRLIQKVVESIVPVGAVAIDPFLGSGTTAVACARTGRCCIGIEKEPRYFNIAVKRIDRELDQPRLFPPAPDQQIQAELFKDA